MGAGTVVVLFNRDLRVHDHPALAQASADAKYVLCLFVFDRAIFDSGYARPNRVTFLLESLADLDASLRERGGGLVVRRGDLVSETLGVANEVGAKAVFTSEDVTWFAQQRQRRLERACADARVELRLFPGITALSPGDVSPSGGNHYRVFSPYHRAWDAARLRQPVDPPKVATLPPDLARGELPRQAELVSGAPSPELLPGGEKEGRRRFAAWLTDGVDDYGSRHDDLPGDATSRLSAYLHFGCLSPLEMTTRARTQDSEGAAAYVRQLAWRDFNHQCIAARPDATWTDYRTHDDQWRDDRDGYVRWQQGRTGFPIVDAGMRQLQREGWMHNRARLITGSFLSKHLYIDWRWGAQHFLDWLIDGDMVNNQMNWQWIAGTGTDTRPYRVLSPLRQAERFDPDGTYVRRYVDELADVPGKKVHQPWKLDDAERSQLDYPEPMVDLREALARFREARQS